MLDGMHSYHEQLKDTAPKLESAHSTSLMTSIYTCADTSLLSTKAVNRMAYLTTRKAALLGEFALTVMTKIL